MKRLWMIFIFFTPLFSQAQDKWEYVEFAIDFSAKGYYAEVSKEDTGIYRQLFWDETTGKPKKFTRPVDIFNKLGELGFELIVIADRPAYPIGRGAVYTFKRPKKS